MLRAQGTASPSWAPRALCAPVALPQMYQPNVAPRPLQMLFPLTAMLFPQLFA